MPAKVINQDYRAQGREFEEVNLLDLFGARRYFIFQIYIEYNARI